MKSNYIIVIGKAVPFCFIADARNTFFSDPSYGTAVSCDPIVQNPDSCDRSENLNTVNCYGKHRPISPDTLRLSKTCEEMQAYAWNGNAYCIVGAGCLCRRRWIADMGRAQWFPEEQA